MTTTETIVQNLEPLPEAAKREVLDFVEFIKARNAREKSRKEEAEWSDFSLASAMQGMEDEDAAYSLADLREVFR